MKKLGVFLGNIIFAAATINAGVVIARDLGQKWEEIEPDATVRQWLSEQKQPGHDEPDAAGCCGVADAYWADDYVDKDGRFYAIITDTRDDVPMKRVHVEPGTRVEIPRHKFNDTSKHGLNHTGHGVVFLGVMDTGLFVYCYFMPGGT